MEARLLHAEYQCGFPGCSRRYCSTDGVRKHARKAHASWLEAADQQAATRDREVENKTSYYCFRQAESGTSLLNKTPSASSVGSAAHQPPILNLLRENVACKRPHVDRIPKLPEELTGFRPLEPLEGQGGTQVNGGSCTPASKEGAGEPLLNDSFYLTPPMNPSDPYERPLTPFALEEKRPAKVARHEEPMKHAYGTVRGDGVQCNDSLLSDLRGGSPSPVDLCEAVLHFDFLEALMSI